MVVKEKLNKSQILEIFQKGIKPESEFKIGLEYERLPIDNETFKAVDYKKTINNFLRDFALLDDWDYINDGSNLIGLKKGHDTITLEPGAQVELSLEPQRFISDLKSKIEDLNKKFKPLLNKYGMSLLEYGVSPVSTHKNIDIIPKRRYHIMANYLWGILSDVMMRETAGIQTCYDFSSEEDAVRKFNIANKLSPFMTAMFANSPIRGGVDTGYKTFRGLSWLNCDSERCGFMSKFEQDFSFEKYVDKVLKTPMIFIIRENSPVNINGRITFEEFMKDGFEGFEADIEDFNLQANLCFPEVRLRNFIEIRNHDCANHGMQYAILAIYKGLLYNTGALSDVEKLLSEFSYRDIAELRYNVPRFGLQSKVNKHKVKDISKEIITIAQNSLILNNEGEEKFLAPIKDLTLKGLSPADVIIKNWNGVWNKDISKLIEHLTV